MSGTICGVNGQQLSIEPIKWPAPVVKTSDLHKTQGR